MKVITFKDYHELSEFAANDIADVIKLKPDLLLCMASGETPKLTCELLVKKLKEDKIDYSRIILIGLDEWVNVPPHNAGSCYHFFQTILIGPLSLEDSQYFLFNGLDPDLDNECAKMDKLINDNGGIDLMVVGIGMNGHIGFNEPGTSFNNFCCITALDEVTRSVGQKYFHEPTEIHKGITIGLAHLLNAKKVFLLANGLKKAALIKNAVEGSVTENFPASIIQKHDNGLVLIDEESGSLLNRTKTADV
jgi:glucosamine-6-phosphate isomerase